MKKVGNQEVWEIHLFKDYVEKDWFLHIKKCVCEREQRNDKKKISKKRIKLLNVCAMGKINDVSNDAYLKE